MDEDEDEEGHSADMGRDSTIRVSGYEGLRVLGTEYGPEGRHGVDEDELITPREEKGDNDFTGQSRKSYL